MTSSSSTVDAASARDMASALERVWWLLLLNGIISLVIGFLVLSWRHETLLVLTYFLGAWLCLIGVVHLLMGMASATLRFPHVLIGLAGLGAGIATLVWPHATIYVIATILGASLFLFGLLDVVGAFLSRATPHWWLGIVKGIVLVGLGIWAIRHPGNALTVLVVIFGVSSAFWGILEVIAAFTARHASRQLASAGTTST